MFKSIGMAIKITETNSPQIAVVNGGLAPELEDGITTYFVFPYDFNAHCQILTEEVFRSNYSFANSENEEYFVDIDEI